MNATIEKFGFPETLLREYEHWLVLVRPAQVTLGSLVIAAKADSTSYGGLPAEAFAEQGLVIAEVERALKAFCAFDKINYLMLMMVDPHVHFHVIPRHREPRVWRGKHFVDKSFPRAPDLASVTGLSPLEIKQMISDVALNFC